MAVLIEIVHIELNLLTKAKFPKKCLNSSTLSSTLPLEGSKCFMYETLCLKFQNVLPRELGRAMAAKRRLLVSQRFGHPHSYIPSVLGIPFSYYCSVLGIPRYPLGMPKSRVFWSSPPKQFCISRENRKTFRDGFDRGW